MNERKSYNPLVPVVRFIGKYLPENDILQGLLIPLIILLPFFLYQFFEHPEYKLTMTLFFGVFYVVIVVWGFMSDIIGKRRHETALQGRTLIQLRDLGFEIENIGKYFGYKGIYYKFFLRIYYNWNSMIPGVKNSKEIAILLHYTPLKTEDDELDVKRLNELNGKYRSSFWFPKGYLLKFEAAYVELHFPFYIFTSFKKVQSRMNQIIMIAAEEKLQPITEKEIDTLIAENAYMYGPPIETFWKAKEIL